MLVSRVKRVEAGAVCAVLLGAAAAFCFADLARAEALGEADCKALVEQHSALIDAEIESDLEQGPEWAKANLAAERLEKLARLIDLEEQLSFRCPRGLAAANLVVNTEPAKAAQSGKPAVRSTGPETGALPTAKANAAPAHKKAAARPKGQSAASKSASRSDAYVPPPPGLGYQPGAYGD